MFKFDNNPDTWQRLDYQIMCRGSIKPYTEDASLKNDISWLESENYNVTEFDCSTWETPELMHFELSDKLEFPGYYGKNYGALNECLNELEITNNGLVVVFRNLDTLNINTAHTLMDIFIASSRRHLLFNERLIILIKVKSNKYPLHPLGSIELSWDW